MRAMGWAGSPTFAGLTLTGPLLAADGSAAAPSYSFATTTNTGIFHPAAGTIEFSISGTDTHRFNSDYQNFVGSVRVGNDGGVFTIGAANDVILARDAANTLAQRNGANAQAFRLYNTYTDVNNYERLQIYWSGSVANIQTTGVGTGANRVLALSSGLGGSFGVGTASSYSWQVDTGGNLVQGASGVIKLNAPITYIGTTYTVAATDNSIVANSTASSTVTLPTASSNTGRTIRVKTIAAFTVVSASSNVVPLAGGAASTAILAATAGKWADLTSDGSNWVIMAGN